MMDDLVAWLRGVLDEDERIARAPLAGRVAAWRARGAEIMYPRNPHVDDPADGGIMTVALGATAEDARHIARHDPARVLREVEAKRRILDECESGIVGWTDSGEKERCRDILCLLALPHEGRPGYREEWRPE